jgi:hypothetical protein
MFIYTCACMRARAHTHTHTHTHTHIYIYIYIYIYRCGIIYIIYMCVCIYMNICVCVYICMNIYVCVCVYIYIYRYMQINECCEWKILRIHISVTKVYGRIRYHIMTFYLTAEKWYRTSGCAYLRILWHSGRQALKFNFGKLEGKLIKGISVRVTGLDDRPLNLLKRKQI